MTSVPVQIKFGDSILNSKIGDSATSMPVGWSLVSCHERREAGGELRMKEPYGED